MNSGSTAAISIAGGGSIALGSALDVTHNGTGLLTLGSVITGNNDITFAGSGTTRFGNTVNNTFTGDVNLNGGTVRFDFQRELGDNANNLIFNGGTLQWVDRDAIQSFNADRELIINAGGGTIDLQSSGLLRVLGEVSGTGNLTVTGSGDGQSRVQFLNTANVNNWTGDLNIIDGGQVDFEDRNTLGTLNRTLTLDDGTLRLIGVNTENLHSNTTFALGAGGGVVNVANSDGLINLRGDITGSGLLTIDGQGTVYMLSEGGANEVKNWDGGISIAGGTVRIDEDIHATNAGALGTGSITLDGGKLEWDGDALGVINRQVTIATGGGEIQANSERLRLQDYTGSGDVTITGGGEVQANDGTNDFSGDWNITGGGMLIATTGAEGSNAMLGTGDVNMDDGTLAFLVGGTDVHTRNTELGAGGGTFQLGNAPAQNPTIRWNGIISGTGDLSISNAGGTEGTFIMGGKNTYTGNTTVEDGSNLTLAAGGELLFIIEGDGVNNLLDGEGSLTLRGAFIFDLIQASDTVGHSWSIIGSDLLSETTFVDGQFSISGFTNDNGVWTSGDYEFSQATGVLTVVPEPATYALFGGLLALGAVLIRRRMK